MLCAVISFFSGLILDTVTHSRREMKRFFRHGSPFDCVARRGCCGSRRDPCRRSDRGCGCARRRDQARGVAVAGLRLTRFGTPPWTHHHNIVDLTSVFLTTRFPRKGGADEHLPSTARLHRWTRRRGSGVACRIPRYAWRSNIAANNDRLRRPSSSICLPSARRKRHPAPPRSL
jgi:hypothetical protein